MAPACGMERELADHRDQPSRRRRVRALALRTRRTCLSTPHGRGDGRIWPWGDRFDSSFVHCAGSVHERATPSKVGAFTGDVSVYGVQDMGGNVREWTASEQRDGFAVVRGGSWTDTSESARCATRSFRPVSFRSGFIGFRLVSDAALPLAKGVRGKKP
jgi:hypothetical protein